MLQQKIHKYAQGRTILVLFIVTQLAYFIMLNMTIPNVREYANDMELLDLKPMGYEAAYAEDLLHNLGTEGREAYLTQQIPLDLIYPGLFAVTYALMLAWLIRYSFGTTRKFNWLVYVPIVAGCFDYLENVGIIVMLVRYPEFSNTLAQLTSLVSIGKSLFTTLFFLVLTFSLGAALWHKLRGSGVKAKQTDGAAV